MADHAHKQIRTAIVTALTNLTTTATRVYANRLRPMADADVPGLRIFLDDENAEVIDMQAAYTQERTVTLVVEACVKATTALDDTLDLISKEVEVALSGTVAVGSATISPIYTGMSFSDEQSDKPVGVKALRFSITYCAQSNAPDVLTS